MQSVQGTGSLGYKEKRYRTIQVPSEVLSTSANGKGKGVRRADSSPMPMMKTPPSPTTSSIRSSPKHKPAPSHRVLDNAAAGKLRAHTSMSAQAYSSQKPAGACRNIRTDGSRRSNNAIGCNTGKDSSAPERSDKGTHMATEDPEAMRVESNLNHRPRFHSEVEVYEDKLRLSAIGTPLWVPQRELNIGDVGFITASGSFHKLFNICVAAEIPHHFSSVHSPLRFNDECRYQDCDPNTYITSASIKALNQDSSDSRSQATKFSFQCSGDEGAILVLPTGAYREELTNLETFRDFIISNAENWYQYIRELKKSKQDGFELRLVTGRLLAQSWATSSFYGTTPGSDSNQVITLTASKNDMGNTYLSWDVSGCKAPNIVTRTSDMRSRTSDTVAMTCFTISANELDADQRNTLDEDVVYDEPQSEESRTIRYSPCEIINRKLLSMKNARDPTVWKLAISHDQDWAAVLKETDAYFPDDTELLDRVAQHNSVRKDQGVVWVQWNYENNDAEKRDKLLKDIERVRAELDAANKEDFEYRTNLLHTIAKKMLHYLRLERGGNTPRSNLLLSVATGYCIEELQILSVHNQDRASSFHLYATALWARFDITKEAKMLEQTITYCRKALAIDPGHREAMADLATALWARYNQYSHPEDLNDVIELHKTLLFRRGPVTPDTLKCLNVIGLAYWARYKRTDKSDDVTRAISYLRRATTVTSTYPHTPESITLSDLGNILLKCSRSSSSPLKYLDEAIMCYRRAVNTVTPLHPHRSAFLSNLGDALSWRFECSLERSDLTEAIRTYEKVLDLPAPFHRDRVTSLMMLGNLYQKKYERYEDVEDLAEAVRRYGEARRLASPVHPKYALVMENLVLAEKKLQKKKPYSEGSASPPPPSSSAVSPLLRHAVPPSHAHAPRKIYSPTTSYNPTKEREREEYSPTASYNPSKDRGSYSPATSYDAGREREREFSPGPPYGPRGTSSSHHVASGAPSSYNGPSPYTVTGTGPSSYGPSITVSGGRVQMTHKRMHSASKPYSRPLDSSASDSESVESVHRATPPRLRHRVRKQAQAQAHAHSQNSAAAAAAAQQVPQVPHV